MKKIALMLACLMSIGMFAGCDKNDSSDEKSSSQVQENESSALDENQPDSDTDFERGVVQNNVYISNFAGLKFTAPEGWEFANDEYIASMMNIGLEVTDNDNDLTKAMLEQTTIYDAVCMEQSTGKNIIIMYENIAKEVPDPATFTADDYLDSVEQQYDSMENVTITSNSDREYVDINGNEYIKKPVHIKYDEMDIEAEQVYYVRKVGNYMLGIIASSGSTSDDMSVYEENFDAYDNNF